MFSLIDQIFKTDFIEAARNEEKLLLNEVNEICNLSPESTKFAQNVTSHLHFFFSLSRLSFNKQIIQIRTEKRMYNKKSLLLFLRSPRESIVKLVATCDNI